MTWKDFFDFSDDQSIQEAIAAISSLERTYQKMISAVEDSNQRLAGDLGAVQNNAEDLLKTVTQLNIGMEKNQKTLTETSTASEDLVKDYMALKQVQADNVKQIDSMTQELNKLAKAKEEAKNKTTAEAGSIDDLRVRLAEAEKAYKGMGAATDQAIKQEQLEKVRGLAAEYKAVNGALTDAKKGAIAAAGSYNELAARVANAKKQLKEMDGGLEANSKEFKELRKFAKEGTEQLKKFDEAVGDNQRKVGDYAGEIGKLAPGFGSLISGIDGATKAGEKFIATPLGMVLLAIAAALGSLMAYFKGSIEGQDDLNKVMKIGGAIFETLKDVVEAVGKALFTAISKPKETWEKFVELIKPLGEMLSYTFAHPLDAMKDFANFLLNAIIKRLEGMGKLISSIGKILSSGFTEGWKELGDAAIQAVTGIEDGVDKIIDALKPLTDEMTRRIELGLKIAALENKLRKDRIADILDDAKTELEVNKLLLESKDKLRFSDEERFAKLRKANALLEDQLKGDLQLIRDEIALQKMIIQQDGETYESRQKLVELQAQEIGLQSKFFQERKRRQQAEIALIREVEKDMIDSAKRISDANSALNTVRLNDTIKTNQKVLADENSMLEQRLAALFEIEDAQQQLLEDDRDKQLAIAKEAALGRVELNAEAIDQIYSQENLSLAQRVQLERTAKEELLSSDVAYNAETLKITEDFNNKTKEILDATTKAAENNVFAILARDADRLQKQIKTTVNDQITALDQALADGNISVAGYQAQRENILKNGAKAELNAQLDFLEEELKHVEDNAQKRIAIEEQISKVRRDLADKTAQDIVAYEQRIAQNVQEIQGQTIALTTELATAGFQKNIQQLEGRLQAESDAKDRSIAIAGDDAQAKALIEQDFANKQKEIQKQIAAEKRKQAIFQKAADATQVIISTAKGVASAVAESPLTFGLPWSAFMAVTGGLQLARILAAPIPQYFQGTQHSVDGLARVAERGREIVIDPSGHATLHTKEAIIDMQGGSKVLPNYKTENIIRQAQQEDIAWQQLVSDGYRNATDRLGTPSMAMDTKGIISSVNMMKREVVEAIANQPQDVFDEKGYRHFESTVGGRVQRLTNRYKLQ